MKRAYSEKIDAFSHISPLKYNEALYKKARHTVHKEIGESVSALADLDERFRMLDRLEGLKQVLTIAQPPIETVVNAKDAVELTKLANDEMSELVTKYPDRFVAGVACLPMNDVDAALREADRAVKELNLKGVQIFTPVNGKPVDSPEFMEIYHKMAEYDLPVWLHPTRERSVPDYVNEDESKYYLFQYLGWPYETSVGMARLVFSGVLEKYPGIKFIVHHCGAMIPFFVQRLGVLPTPWLKNPSEEYFKMFYGDTALRGNINALMCGYAFFGAEHILFGTDMPREKSIAKNIASIESMDIPDASKKMIFSDNVKKLLHLPGQDTN